VTGFAVTVGVVAAGVVFICAICKCGDKDSGDERIEDGALDKPNVQRAPAQPVATGGSRSAVAQNQNDYVEAQDGEEYQYLDDDDFLDDDLPEHFRGTLNGTGGMGFETQPVWMQPVQQQYKPRAWERRGTDQDYPASRGENDPETERLIALIAATNERKPALTRGPTAETAALAALFRRPAPAPVYNNDSSDHQQFAPDPKVPVQE
jgi:hypothetical protein